MQFSQIIDAIQDTVSDETSSSETAIKRYINWGQEDIASRKDWSFLFDSKTFNTVAGTAEYELDSTVKKLITLRDTTNKVDLPEVDYRTFIVRYPNSTDQNKPMIWYSSELTTGGVQQIKLFPIPDGVYTIAYDFYKRLTDLSANEDISVIPERYHHLLVDYAIWHYFEKDQDGQANYYAVKFQNELEIMMRDYAESDAGGVMKNIKYDYRGNKNFNI